MTPTDNELNVGDYVTADSDVESESFRHDVIRDFHRWNRTVLDRMQVSRTRWDDIGLPQVLETGQGLALLGSLSIQQGLVMSRPANTFLT